MIIPKLSSSQKIRNGAVLTHINDVRRDAKTFLHELARSVYAEAINNVIEIPVSEGTGIIRLIEAGEGLNVILFDIELKAQTTFHRFFMHAGAGNAFTLLSTLTPENLLIYKLPNDTEHPTINFYCGNEEAAITVLPGHRVKAVMINMSSDWIRKEFKEADPDLLFLVHDLICQTEDFSFSDQANFTMHHTLMAMCEHSLKNPSDTFCVKAKTTSVLYDILTRMLAHTVTLHEGSAIVKAKMQAVEKILDDHLDKMLPSLQVIAKEVSLSESTLKRNFKQVYDVSIYEYYLKKKMHLARQLLEEQSIAVKEVAYILGYEKTSNFIKIFKKHYEFSPGLFKKKLRA